MNDAPAQSFSGGWLKAVLFWTITSTLIYFFAWDPWRVHHYWPDVQYSTLGWLYNSWNAETSHWRYSWLVVCVMVVFVIHGIRRMKEVPISCGRWGLGTIAAGMLCHATAIRIEEMRFSVAGLVLLILGSVHFAAGWQRARLVIFPLSLTLLLVPLPIHRVSSYFFEPMIRFAGQLYRLSGGEVDPRGWAYVGSLVWIHFQYLIPILLTAAVVSRCCYHAGWGRLLIVLLAFPLTFFVEAMRLVVETHLLVQEITLPYTRWWSRCELIVVLTLSAACFILACRLTGGRWRKPPHSVRPGVANEMKQAGMADF
jgi:hypothetical protein